MIALTIQQPYAELIRRGEKLCENRAWSTHHRGTIAIHAGKGTDYLFGEWWAAYNRRELVTGAVVAVARLVDCISVYEIDKLAPSAPEIAALVGHEHAEGPVCWVLADITPIDPIPARGAQGLWVLHDHTERAVTEQLRASGRTP